jgi:hypothetical protein
VKRYPSFRLYIVLGILFLLSSFYFLIGYRVGLNVYDEGIMVYGATRILNGDIPYRDFRVIYAPAQFYVLAATFKIFGTSIIVERILAVVLQSSLGICVYLLARKLVPHKLALISWFLFVVGTYLSREIPIASNTTPALLFAFLSCLCLTKYLSGEQHGRRSIVLAGILAGITTLFRHDFGFYTFISGFFVVSAFTYRIFNRPTKTIKKRIMSALSACLRYSAGTGAILIPVCIFFISICPIDVLISDLILLPLKIYPQFRSLPYPYPSVTDFIHFMESTLYVLPPFYVPIAILAATAILLITRIYKGRRLSEKDWLAILCLLMAGISFNYVRVRADFGHLLPFQLPSMVLFPWLFQGIIQEMKHRFHQINRGLVWTLAFLLAVLLVIYPLSGKIRNTFTLLTAKLLPLNLERTQGIFCSTKKDPLALQYAVEYIKRHVPPGERIFVGNFRHDQIFVNDVMFYFLSNRDSATRYYHFDPGVQTTRAVQQIMINEIKKNTVNYIVLWNGKQWPELNESSKSSGVHDLDNFINQNYKAVERFGLYTILRRINQSPAQK